MKRKLDDQTIALRVGREIHDGECVNLGSGIPTLVANYIEETKTIVYHSETGLLGYGHVLNVDEQELMDYDLVNAGGQFVAYKPGMCVVDVCQVFALARGGHVDVTVLGAMQVSERGDLANWTFDREAKTGGIGGGMDMPVGSKRVIVAMKHVASNGERKILKRCTYPLTCQECVDLIVTDIAVIAVTGEGLLLKEVAPGWSAGEVQALTEPRLIIADDLKEIEL